MTDDYKHHYTAIQEHLETLKTLKAPIYEVEGKSHYLEIIKHAERLKDLKGPVMNVEKLVTNTQEVPILPRKLLI